MSNRSQKSELIFKVIMIGDSNVGKTRLIDRYVNDKFNPYYSITIGLEFCSHDLIIDGKSVKIQIWDSSGQEKYKSLTKIYYKGAVGVFYIYDITRKETFDNIKSQWLTEFKSNSMSDIVGILIGNKCDLTDKRDVTIEEATLFAEQNSNISDDIIRNGFYGNKC